jgi:hypothetical protein
MTLGETYLPIPARATRSRRWPRSRNPVEASIPPLSGPRSGLHPQASKEFKKDNDKDHRRVVSLFVLKNRNRELAEIKLIFQPDLATFVRG